VGGVLSSVRKVAVLGCGYVGARVLRLLRARGVSAFGVVRSASSAAALAAEGLVVSAFDLDSADWSGLDGDCNGVVFAASAGGGGPEAYVAAYDHRVRRAVQWAKAVGATRFVLTSSTGVYRQDGGVTVDEHSPAGGDQASDAILAGEGAVSAGGFAQARVLRLGGLYGPGRHYLLDAFRRGETVVGGRSDHFINYLHGDDAASSVVAALECGPDGYRVYNVTDGSPVTKADLARWIAGRLGLPPPIFKPDAPAGPRLSRGGRSQPSRRILSSLIGAELRWRPLHRDVFGGLESCMGGLRNDSVT
jgi:nucleoside-diphosphate-sugar epimerase